MVDNDWLAHSKARASHIYCRVRQKEKDILDRGGRTKRVKKLFSPEGDTHDIYIWDVCKPVHRRWGGGCKDGDGGYATGI